MKSNGNRSKKKSKRKRDEVEAKKSSDKGRPVRIDIKGKIKPKSYKLQVVKKCKKE